jgi:hypothetical protein
MTRALPPIGEPERLLAELSLVPGEASLHIWNDFPPPGGKPLHDAHRHG